MSNILVTGGAGFLGTALCNKLVEQNHQVVAFDNFSRKSHIDTGLNNQVKIHRGDIRTNYELYNTEYNFDIIYHLSFINGTRLFYEIPHTILDVGITGILNILNYIKYIEHSKYFKFILASSSEVYGQPTHIPTTEDERLIIPDPRNPRYSYSGGKIISELMTINYAKMCNFNASIFRPHNIYGPNMGFEHIIPEIIQKILKPKNAQYQDNKLLVPIQGTGNETRAFCYIDDAINAIILSATQANQSCPIFNVGAQDEIKISEVINIIANILEIKIQIVPGEKMAGATDRRCPDMTKLANIGYIPRVGLREGLEKTVQWYKNCLNENTNS